jgi:NIPSNAP
MTTNDRSCHAPTDRRGFVRAAGAVAGAAVLGAPAAASAAVQSSGEYYELRAYHLRRGPKEQIVSDYLQHALVPALRRLGTGPVGVFAVAVGPDSPTMHVLIPHPSMESVGALSDRLAADDEYRRAGAAFLDAPASDPAYDRIESSLFSAFAGHPKLAVPPQLAAGKGRLLELRRYESHSERASATKIDVFNRAEIAIFARHGMHAVFYGRALVGSRLPNLTYLLAFDDMRDRDTRWGEFGADPEFRALISKPEFADAAIVSSISNMFLRPTAYSQI